MVGNQPRKITSAKQRPIGLQKLDCLDWFILDFTLFTVQNVQIKQILIDLLNMMICVVSAFECVNHIYHRAPPNLINRQTQNPKTLNLVILRQEISTLQITDSIIHECVTTTTCRWILIDQQQQRTRHKSELSASYPQQYTQHSSPKITGELHPKIWQLIQCWCIDLATTDLHATLIDQALCNPVIWIEIVLYIQTVRLVMNKFAPLFTEKWMIEYSKNVCVHESLWVR